RLRVSADVVMKSAEVCERCGYISSNRVCKACVLLEGLERGLPRMGIGRVAEEGQGIRPRRPVEQVHFALLAERAARMRSERQAGAGKCCGSQCTESQHAGSRCSGSQCASATCT
ncbi:cytosolic thiouridylase subunit Ctu1, partial [Coemansia sp. RSA 2603]